MNLTVFYYMFYGIHILIMNKQLHIKLKNKKFQKQMPNLILLQVSKVTF